MQQVMLMDMGLTLNDYLLFIWCCTQKQHLDVICIVYAVVTWCVVYLVVIWCVCCVLGCYVMCFVCGRYMIVVYDVLCTWSLCDELCRWLLYDCWLSWFQVRTASPAVGVKLSVTPNSVPVSWLFVNATLTFVRCVEQVGLDCYTHVHIRSDHTF